MKTKPSFIIRNTDKSNNTTLFDALKVIDYYLSLHPSNTLIPNSPLYQAAIKQYNSNIKNTMIRPEIPSWFCGKINPETNELIALPSDDLLRTSAGFIADPTQEVEPYLLSPSSGYVIDNCLYWGTPGSYEYTLCTLRGGGEEEDFEVSGIDWLSSLTSAQEEADSESENNNENNDNKKKDIDHMHDEGLYFGIGNFDFIDPITGYIIGELVDQDKLSKPINRLIKNFDFF